MTRTGLTAVLALSSAIGAGFAGCGGAPPVASLPPPEVSVSQPIERAVSDSLEFTGRVEAVEAVDVRARVSGYITKVAFNAGARVKEGDLLFEIDPREYQAAVDHAEGEIAKLRANLTRASAEVTRTQRLKSTGAVSEREMDTATGSKGATEGELVTARAQLAKAQLDLQFTRVTAPIAGRASRAEITAGNLVVVGADGGPILTTIVSSDPVWVYFDIDEPLAAAPARGGASPHRSPPHAGDHRELADPGAARPRERNRLSPHRADRLHRQPGRSGDRDDAGARRAARTRRASSRPASSCA